MEQGEYSTFDVAKIKRETEDQAAYRAQKIYLSLRVLITVIVLGTLWFARLEYNLARIYDRIGSCRGAVEIIWEKVFGYKMPP